MVPAQVTNVRVENVWTGRNRITVDLEVLGDPKPDDLRFLHTGSGKVVLAAEGSVRPLSTKEVYDQLDDSPQNLARHMQNMRKEAAEAKARIDQLLADQAKLRQANEILEKERRLLTDRVHLLEQGKGPAESFTAIVTALQGEHARLLERVENLERPPALLGDGLPPLEEEVHPGSF